MSAQPSLFSRVRKQPTAPVVDEVRKGWVVPHGDGQVRVHGRDADGGFVAALADVNGRDLRPHTFVTLPADHARLKVSR